MDIAVDLVESPMHGRQEAVGAAVVGKTREEASMAGYSGIRRQERRKLNRSRQYSGGALSFSWTASGALGRVLRQIRKDLESLDKRTNPNQNLRAAVKRVELLQKEISR